MTITFDFDRGSHDVLHFQLPSKWTWQELLEKINDSTHTVDLSKRTDVIVTVADPNFVPPGALEKMRNIGRNTPVNGGLMIIVGMNSVTSAVIDVLRRVYPDGKIWRSVRTIDDARAMIARDRGARTQ